MIEVVRAKGHRNVLSTHRNTIEFTKEHELTPRGDCIIAVSADKGCIQLPEEFKKALKDDKAVLEITIECGGVKEKVTAKGNHNLILSHPTDAVIRKSDFICPRTLAVKADKAAVDLDRKLVNELKSGNPVLLTLNVKN